MDHPQLFDAGHVRSGKRGWNPPLRERLVGDGWIKWDPQTRRYYQVEGRNKFRPASPYDCAGGCGATVYRAPKQVRKYGQPVCEDCLGTWRDSPIGTKRLNAGGYVEIKTQNGRDGWRLEHRLVMEGTLGRELRSEETVHHINGVRDDNRAENLQLRQGHHGRGAAFVCADCGSHNVTPVRISG